MYLTSLKEKIYNRSLSELSDDKILINCLNAHSFNVLQKDELYRSAMLKSHVVLPDGIAIVFALRFLASAKLRKISGHELFFFEIRRLNQMNGKCFFLGSTELTNSLIEKRISKEYPNITFETFSPPFKKEFNEEENRIIIDKINAFQPDDLFIGMTAPKQEKWANAHFNDLNVKRICSIGAVFDFYAETCKYAPEWMINIGLEWLHRLINDPKRLWRRYIFGNPKFVTLIFMEKLKLLEIEFKQKMIKGSTN